MAISLRIGSNMERAFQSFSRRVDIASQRALLKAGQAVRDAEREEMARVFVKPTNWTLNAFKVVNDPAAMKVRVQVKDGYWYRADNYLQDQIEGTGDRRLKAFELALQRVLAMPAGYKALPGQKAKLDAYGNQSVGEIRQILSWFDGAERWSGSTQNMGAKGREKKRKGTRNRRGFEYFSVMPGSKKGKLVPGIYRRTLFAFVGPRGGTTTAVEPVMIFVPRASYRKRFDFYGVAQRTADREIAAQFAAAMGRG